MRVLLIGVGTVGEAIARLAATHRWCESMLLADYDTARAETLQAKLGDAERFPVEHIDARDGQLVAALARRHRSDLVMNAVDPQFVMPIFEGALDAGTHYMDMAASLSAPHPTHPFTKPGLKLGDLQFARHADWEHPGTPATTCSTRFTRSTCAMEVTWRSLATPSPRCSASGPPSRSA